MISSYLKKRKASCLQFKILYFVRTEIKMVYKGSVYHVRNKCV